MDWQLSWRENNNENFPNEWHVLYASIRWLVRFFFLEWRTKSVCFQFGRRFFFLFLLNDIATLPRNIQSWGWFHLVLEMNAEQINKKTNKIVKIIFHVTFLILRRFFSFSSLVQVYRWKKKCEVCAVTIKISFRRFQCYICIQGESCAEEYKK